MTFSRKLMRRVSANRSVLILFLLVAFFALRSSQFLSSTNLSSVLIQTTFTGIIGVGMAVAFIGREFDLSVGSILALSGFVAVSLSDKSPALAFAAAALAGAGCGLVNGLIVGVMRVNAFIATLGTMSAISGLTLLLSNEQSVASNSPTFLSLATKQVGPIPIFAIAFAVLALVTHLVMERTPVGVTIRALGNNPEFCRVNGVALVKYRVGLFVFTGLTAGISGAMTASWVGGADPNAGQNTALLVFSAVILGGVSLYGGVGTIPQAVGGVLVLTVFVNGMTLLNISPYYQTCFEGVVLVAVVTAAALVNTDVMTKVWLSSLRARIRSAWAAGLDVQSRSVHAGATGGDGTGH
jgi:ribose/xylose/arabinose/galactoside ABC-type transport system permease subunit